MVLDPTTPTRAFLSMDVCQIVVIEGRHDVLFSHDADVTPVPVLKSEGPCILFSVPVFNNTENKQK